MKPSGRDLNRAFLLLMASSILFGCCLAWLFLAIVLGDGFVSMFFNFIFGA